MWKRRGHRYRVSKGLRKTLATPESKERRRAGRERWARELLGVDQAIPQSQGREKPPRKRGPQKVHFQIRSQLGSAKRSQGWPPGSRGLTREKKSRANMGSSSTPCVATTRNTFGTSPPRWDEVPFLCNLSQGRTRLLPRNLVASRCAISVTQSSRGNATKLQNRANAGSARSRRREPSVRHAALQRRRDRLALEPFRRRRARDFRARAWRPRVRQRSIGAKAPVPDVANSSRRHQTSLSPQAAPVTALSVPVAKPQLIRASGSAQSSQSLKLSRDLRKFPFDKYRLPRMVESGSCSRAIDRALQLSSVPSAERRWLASQSGRAQDDDVFRLEPSEDFPAARRSEGIGTARR